MPIATTLSHQASPTKANRLESGAGIEPATCLIASARSTIPPFLPPETTQYGKPLRPQKIEGYVLFVLKLFFCIVTLVVARQGPPGSSHNESRVCLCCVKLLRPTQPSNFSKRVNYYLTIRMVSFRYLGISICGVCSLMFILFRLLGSAVASRQNKNFNRL